MKASYSFSRVCFIFALTHIFPSVIYFFISQVHCGTPNDAFDMVATGVAEGAEEGGGTAWKSTGCGGGLELLDGYRPIIQFTYIPAKRRKGKSYGWTQLFD